MHAGLPKYVHVNLRDIEDAKFKEGEGKGHGTVQQWRRLREQQGENAEELFFW